jgi:hypothetical protein
LKYFVVVLDKVLGCSLGEPQTPAARTSLVGKKPENSATQSPL